jgi:TDG/mug DNA glycosylase family protein
MVTGAGFDVVGVDLDDAIDAVRARTLPDYVGPAMSLLMVGLNPSPYAADAGVGFARPGNRFWPAMIRAGLATRPRDPRHLLLAHRIGLTDMVKRATPGVRDIAPEEFVTGMGRIERLAGWLVPEAVCFLGVTGWRHAVDRSAACGWQARRIGGRPVYVMPNPSGANAHVRPDDLVAHLLAAAGHHRPPRPADAAPAHLDPVVGVDHPLEMPVREEDLTSMGRAVHAEDHARSTTEDGPA